jgi:hypothetical protein
MSWVDEWSSSEVFIQDAQLRNIPFWRSLSYYVDPDGSEIIELGTKRYPYKHPSLAFIEILNIHSHTERTVSVYLKELTTSYMNHGQNYMVNMTKVNIESYTDGINSPGRAIIYAVDYDLTIFSPVSVFNLLVNSTLNLLQKIEANGITLSEQRMIVTTDSVFYPLRTSLSINNINVFRDILTENQKTSYFVKPLHLQEKSVSLSNMNFQITGFILYTIDPMSLYASNLYVDFHATMGGFVMRLLWNYPEAYVNGTILINNATVINPQERIAPFREGFIIHDSSQFVTINNTRVLFWGNLAEDKGQFEKHLSPNCNPQDDVLQTVDITHNYWSMTYNPTGNRFVTFYTEFYSDYYRKVIVNYSYNMHENILNSVYALNLVYWTQNTEIWMRNNEFHNVSGLQGAAYAVVSSKFIIENELFLTRMR